ncbi:hypothetical protein [Methylobacterium sp. Leaf106]|uniref:hypothetical protein n=1 Tax=Methylobacterium sp. Leaf106 TaxID=1736255 RepID=UPI000A8C474E|nr:hypothetical protein [Methylobacterium sp. Leaf106]
MPKTHKISIILHVLKDAMFRAAIEKLGADHIKLISLRSVALDEIEGVIGDIMSCEEIVSTSLHGVICFPCLRYSLSVAPRDERPGKRSGFVQDTRLQALGRSR